MGGYDETLRERAAQGAEDWKLIVKLAATGNPVFTPRNLVAYRLTRSGMSQASPDRQLAAIDAVIGDLRSDFPDTDPRLFRCARTMMTAWLLPAFLRQRRFSRVLREAGRAYLLNPFWWRNANLRLVHAARLRMALGLSQRESWKNFRLADLREGEERPFAFLDKAFPDKRKPGEASVLYSRA
jgi:hypothetical protein